MPRPSSAVKSPQIMLPPLGEGRGGGCWRCKSQRSVANTWSPYIPHPTFHILVKPPPAASQPPPRGEVFKAVIKQRRSDHDALGSGFQLAQVSDLLGWNDEIGWGVRADSRCPRWRIRQFSTKTPMAKHRRQNFVTPAFAGVQTGSPSHDQFLLSDALLPPLGEGRGGGCWRCISYKSVADVWPAYIPPIAFRILTFGRQQPSASGRPLGVEVVKVVRNK